MAKETYTARKTLILIVSLAAVAGFMLLELTRYHNASHYITGSNVIYEVLGLNRKASYTDPNITILLYFNFGAPSLLAYFLTVLYPRNHSLESGSTSKKYWWAAGILMTCAVIHMLMCRNDIYPLLVPRYGVIQTVENLVYNYLPVTNLFLVPLWLLASILLAELPSTVRNRKRIFAPGAVKASICRYALCAVIAVLGLLASGALLGMLNPINSEAVRYVIRGFSSDNRSLARIFISIICAPLFEELAFRGVILGKLKKQIPTWCALILSAVCFGLWHLNLGQFVYTTMLGLVFGAVYLYTGRLRYAMFVHALNNILSTMAMSTASDGFFPRILFLYETREFLLDMGFAPALLTFAILAVLIVLLLRLLRKIGEPYSLI